MTQTTGRTAIPAWGVRFTRFGKRSLLGPIEMAELPQTAIVPLQQHIGLPTEPAVRPGDYVLTGQPLTITDRPGMVVPVHAPLSGTVISIESREVPERGMPRRPCVVIQSDERDERFAGTRAYIDPLRMAPQDIRYGIGEAGIVGLGGAMFPTGVKLNPYTGVKTLILNGAECEPHISCDKALLRERPAGVLAGAQIMLRALECSECLIAVKEYADDQWQPLEQAMEKLGDDRLRLLRVPDIYPIGGERQLIEYLLGKQVPSEGLPWDIGVVCHNVATASAVADYFVGGRPLISRIVTITGNGIARPCNLDARIGTPIADLIRHAGGYVNDPQRLIMGGPMMGIALPSDQLSLTKATNCLYVATAAELPATATELPCIRCGYCASACPANLMPQFLHTLTRSADLLGLQQAGVKDCIECGCCDDVCPSHIPLTQNFLHAKQALWEQQSSSQRARHAQDRHTARQERLASAERDRLQQLQNQTLAALPEPAKDPIAELMQRVRKRSE